ncbi:cytidine deaminase [Arcanobacterium hippocoleae]|uniref:Cytidine deaminase n=1 Tax=Arcanobacterium hippocoleae TaxID=149017 RepID=A0ABU1T1B3_9ACTO|nr:cytidine deaminase [Arcanobacterium hippocoleae]MDR6938641.1 cytidine deaminase [Arcanobacterium hippocoleae]
MDEAMMLDWEELIYQAQAAMKCAYAPYSHYPVGAAGLTETGVIYTGCNVENASTGLGLCAECGMISAMIRAGASRLVAVACVNKENEVITPCGRCRQLIYEHGGSECLVAMPQGPMSLAQLLPGAFGPSDLGKISPVVEMKEAE